MPRRCKVCDHPQRAEIEREMLSRRYAWRELERRWDGQDSTSMRRHMKSHMRESDLAQAQALIDAARLVYARTGAWPQPTKHIPQPPAVVVITFTQEKTLRPYVKLYREGDEMAIQTNATNEDEFMALASEALSQLVTENRIGEDWEFAFRFWLPQITNLACKLRGYKAPDVDEQRVLTAGRIAPSDSALLVTQQAAQNGNGSAVHAGT